MEKEKMPDGYKSQKEVLKYIGKDTIMKFENLIDDIVTFRSPMPISIKGNHYFYEVQLINQDNDILMYDTCEDVFYKRTLLSFNLELYIRTSLTQYEKDSYISKSVDSIK